MSQAYQQHCGSLSITQGGHTHSSCSGSSEWVSRSCQAIKAFTTRHESHTCTMTPELCSLMQNAVTQSTPTDDKLCLERALSKSQSLYDHSKKHASIVEALPRP